MYDLREPGAPIACSCGDGENTLFEGTCGPGYDYQPQPGLHYTDELSSM